jgi:hypothetical protein
MQHVPDAWWIGRGLPGQSLLEEELTDELDALCSVMSTIDRLLDTSPHAESLASLGYQVQERIEEIERDLRSMWHYL